MHMHMHIAIPSYLIRIIGSWISGTFCLAVWTFIYYLWENKFRLSQTLPEIASSIPQSLWIVIPVGIIIGEILGGLWELLTEPLFSPKSVENSEKWRDVNCDKPFENIVAMKELLDNRSSIFINEFAWLFTDKERAYNSSELHFATARTLGAVSAGVGIITIIYSFLIGYLIESWVGIFIVLSISSAIGLFIGILLCKLTYRYKSWCLVLIVLVILQSLLVFLITCPCLLSLSGFPQTHNSGAIASISCLLVMFGIAFYSSIKYRDFANFIIIIGGRLQIPMSD